MAVATGVSPEKITRQYMRAFHKLHGRAARIEHKSGDWYRVNGEFVHRSIVEHEIERLQTLSLQKRSKEASVVKRLIARLRNM